MVVTKLSYNCLILQLLDVDVQLSVISYQLSIILLYRSLAAVQRHEAAAITVETI